MGRAFLLFRLVALTCLSLFVVFSTSYAQQESSTRRIGILQGGSWSDEWMRAFKEGLQEQGYEEGRNLVISWRAANGNFDRLPELAASLVQNKVDVILADGTMPSRAAKRATSTVPIVMSGVADPIGSGLVANLARPGGNVTGLSMMTSELSPKRLHLFKEAVPRLTHIAVLWNPATPYHPKMIDELKVAAPSVSIKLTFVSIRRPEDIDPTFSAVGRAHAQALYIIEDALFVTHRVTLLTLATKARLPTMSAQREYVDAGALMSYGPKVVDLFRRSAGYVGKILKGARPADLPIEQPTKFELVVNLKTAKALGITIPESILLRADEVIR